MVGSDQVPPERLQRALVEAAVEQFRDRTTTIGLSPSVPASCFARLGEKNQKQEQPRNEAQLHFVSLRSQFHYGARGGLSRVEMNALRAPLTALPVPKGICRLFLLDGADALIDGRLTGEIKADEMNSVPGVFTAHRLYHSTGHLDRFGITVLAFRIQPSAARQKQAQHCAGNPSSRQLRRHCSSFFLLLATHKHSIISV